MRNWIRGLTIGCDRSVVARPRRLGNGATASGVEHGLCEGSTNRPESGRPDAIGSKKAWNRQWDYNPEMASAEHGSHQPVRSTDPQPDGTLAKDLASEDILEILRLPDGTIKYQHSIGSPIVRGRPR